MTIWNKTIITATALLMAAAPLWAQEPFAGPAVAAVASPRAASAPAADPAPDRESDLYDEGTNALNASQWQNTLTAFDQVAQMRGAHADGALYWKAYALNKLGRREDALAALSTLEKSYAQSHWNNDAKALEVEIRQSMGEAVSPDNVSNEDLKLIAINGLMNSDPERAVPLLEKVLQGNQPPKVKERALFVLSQSGSPKARAIIASIARGQGDRTLQKKALEDLALFGGKESKAELAEIYATSDDVEVKRSILRGFMISGEKDRVLATAKTEKNPGIAPRGRQAVGGDGRGQ